MSDDCLFLPYLEDVTAYLGKARAFTLDMDYESFCRDEKTIFAVIRALEVAGEAVKHVPEPFRKQHPRVPWGVIAGMRDVLVHDYAGIDLETVWHTVQNDIPDTIETLESLIGEIER